MPQPHAAIYAGAAAYLFGFGLMCFMVKEGEYPRPRTGRGATCSRTSRLRQRLHRCRYWHIFLYTTCGGCGQHRPVRRVLQPVHGAGPEPDRQDGRDRQRGGVGVPGIRRILWTGGTRCGLEAYINAYTAFFAFGSIICSRRCPPPRSFLVGVTGRRLRRAAVGHAGATSLPG